VALVDGRAHTNLPASRACVDWTERRHHPGGALGATVFSWLAERRWISTIRGDRTFASRCAAFANSSGSSESRLPGSSHRRARSVPLGSQWA